MASATNLKCFMRVDLIRQLSARSGNLSGGQAKSQKGLSGAGSAEGCKMHRSPMVWRSSVLIVVSLTTYSLRNDHSLWVWRALSGPQFTAATIPLTEWAIRSIGNAAPIAVDAITPKVGEEDLAQEPASRSTEPAKPLTRSSVQVPPKPKGQVETTRRRHPTTRICLDVGGRHLRHQVLPRRGGRPSIWGRAGAQACQRPSHTTFQ